jgi:hypothetical protein
VTVPTDRHETYGPSGDLPSDYRSETRGLGAVGTCQKDIYPLLPLCTLSCLALDSQYTTVFALCYSPGFSPSQMLELVILSLVSRLEAIAVLSNITLARCLKEVNLRGLAFNTLL